MSCFTSNNEFHTRFEAIARKNSSKWNNMNLAEVIQPYFTTM